VNRAIDSNSSVDICEFWNASEHPATVRVDILLVILKSPFIAIVAGQGKTYDENVFRWESYISIFWIFSTYLPGTRRQKASSSLQMTSRLVDSQRTANITVKQSTFYTQKLLTFAFFPVHNSTGFYKFWFKNSWNEDIKSKLNNFNFIKLFFQINIMNLNFKNNTNISIWNVKHPWLRTFYTLDFSQQSRVKGVILSSRFLDSKPNGHTTSPVF